MGIGPLPPAQLVVPARIAPPPPRPVAPYLVDARPTELTTRMAPAVLDFLTAFHDTRRGQRQVRAWYRRAGRWTRMIDRALLAADLPRDLRCVAMIESGFDPTARSHAGAAGMWQFVERTGEAYDLPITRWEDARLDPERSTAAAARYLGRLREMLGSWELALAGYNMGQGALLRAMRRYGTNDYWHLAALESAIPVETTRYVAKILACAVVMQNPDRFGLSGVTPEPTLELETLVVPGGTPLRRLASWGRISAETLSEVNPALLRGRTPPGSTYRLHVPREAAERLVEQLRRRAPAGERVRTHALRFGETLRQVAYQYRTREARIREMNDLGADDIVRPGTVLDVPDVEPRPLPAATETPIATVPGGATDVPGRARVFYRTLRRDQPARIARFFDISVDELASWNHIDPHTILPSGLVLQIFVAPSFDRDTALLLAESDVRVVVSGSAEHREATERRTESRPRTTRYRVRRGDTLGAIARRHGLSATQLARMNRIRVSSTLRIGQSLTVPRRRR